ncbi:hypothetical protein ACFLTE_09875, partial [Bacteroidota bacterium]
MSFIFSQDNTYNSEYIAYQVSDGLHNSQVGILNVNNLLNGVSLPMNKSLKAGNTIALNDSVNVNLGESIELYLQGLDLTPPFDSCIFEIIDVPQFGFISVSKELKAYTAGSPLSISSIKYYPTVSDDQILMDRIKYKVTNADGSSDTANIMITINNQYVNEDDSILIVLSYEDLDSDPTLLNWSISSPNLSDFSYRYFNQTSTEISLMITPPHDYEGNVV